MSNRFLIITAEFNETVTRALADCAEEVLIEARASVDKLWVPGAFELPVLAKKAAQSGAYNAIICLGAVVRGETPHFDYICDATTRGLMDVSLSTEVPIINGVLTADTMDQAFERSNRKSTKNKGRFAAQAAIAMSQNMLDLNQLVKQ